MGPKRKQSANADVSVPNPGEDVLNTDQFKLIVLELLSDEDVLLKMKKILYPKGLADKIDSMNKKMNKKIDGLTASIEVRDAIINELEQQVNSLETDLEGLEQYSGRTNLQLQGIPDTANGEDIEAKIMDIVNNQIGLTPPLETNETVRCHLMGRTPNKRSILVKFHSERRRDVII